MSLGKGGKGCSKGCKRTPEQHGFQAKGKLYIRPSQLKRALPLDFSAGLELSNLQRPEVLPPGSASVEVLCSRQSILGNPFCMQRDGGDEESARHMVCDAFEVFLQRALMPEMTCSLMDVAEATVSELGVPRHLIGKDWASKFGSTSCEEYHEAFADLKDLFLEHGGICFLCHCAPKRCHAQSVASHLSLFQRLGSYPLKLNSRLAREGTLNLPSLLCNEEHPEEKTLKERRKLQKALRDIAALEDRFVSGQQLQPEQISKMEKKDAYMERLNKLTGW